MSDLSISEKLAVEFAQGKLNTERATLVPAIATPSLDVKSLRDSIIQIKQALDTRENRAGSVLDKFVTLRDLLNNDTLRIKVGGQVYAGNPGSSITILPGAFGDTRPNLSTPPIVTNLAATGAFRQILLTWDQAEYSNHAFAEIWRHTADAIGSAVKIGTTSATIYDDSSGTSAVQYFYWVRLINQAGQHGAFNAVAGVSATLAQAGTGDLTVGSITAASGIIGSLSADVITTGTLAAARIAAGSLNADKITAGTITVDRLIIRGSPGSNAVPDPEGRDISAWQGGTATSVTDTTSPTGRALSMTSQGSANYLSAAIPIDRTKDYLLRMTVKQHSGTPNNYLGIIFYNSSGTPVVGSGWPSQGTYDYWGRVNQTVSSSAYVEYEIAFGPGCGPQIPATAVSCSPLFLANYSAAGELRATNIIIEPLPAGHNQWVARDTEAIVRGTSWGKHLTGTSSWTTAGIYSKSAYTGGAYVKWKARSVTTYMIGLNASASSTSTNYTTLDYAIYLTSGGNVEVYESGAGGGVLTTYVAGDEFSVVYDGFNVRYSKNGVVFKTTAAANALVLSADSSIYSVAGYVADNVEFGPMNPGTQITSSNASTYLANQSIGTAQIIDANITTAKIADANITTAKIGNLQVTSATIANLTVGTTKITGSAVTQCVSGTTAGSARNVTSVTSKTTTLTLGTITTSADGDGEVLVLLSPNEWSSVGAWQTSFMTAEASITGTAESLTIAHRIKRDSTVIASQSLTAVAGGTVTRFASLLVVADTPGAGGTYTYSMEIYTTNVSATNMAHEIIPVTYALLETRK